MDYFKLHGNCIVVKGASKALIYDLFEYRTVGISLQFAQLYETEFLTLPYEKILEKYADFKDQIKELTDSLIENDFGFFTDEPESFPVVNTSYMLKKRIYSAVIELDTKSLDQYVQLFSDLMALDCSKFYLLVREEIKGLDKFEKLLMTFKESRATWVEVIFDKPYLTFDQLKEVTRDMRIRYNIFSAPKDEVIEGRWWFDESIYKFHLVEYKTKAFDLDTKSQYGPDYFWHTLAIFTEAQEYNPFFNLKVCVSKEGEFKNDLSLEESFGNFRSRSLEDLLKDEGFKRLWNISNDEIEKCKDCQYRYQCQSNSDIIEENNKYFKVDTCNYNPYENVWD